VNLGSGHTATKIDCGVSYTCAILDNGEVKCWGANNQGQLGQDSTTSIGTAAGHMAGLSSVNLGSGRTATAISSAFVVRPAH